MRSYKLIPPGSPAPPEGAEAATEAALRVQRTRWAGQVLFSSLQFSNKLEAIPGAAVAPCRQSSRALSQKDSHANPVGISF